MILTGRGLAHRLDGAWWMTLVLAAGSIMLAFVKGFELGEAVLLAVLLATLLLTRNIFNRPASLIEDRLTPSWWLCVGTILALGLAILFFVYKEVDYSHELWWQFEFTATAPRSLRAALGIGLTAGAVAVWLLTRPPAGRSPRPTAAELSAADRADRQNQPLADANLVRMGDKSLLFSANGDAFLMYRKRGRSWIALFDPIGNPAAHSELVWRFVELARRHGGRAVFYEVPGESLSIYADAGLSAFKLGEEASVRLDAFDLKGSRRASIRTALNKAERDGIVFELLPVERVGDVMDELERVSAAWLAEHAVREKAFSLGAFERGYIATQPVAVLKRQGRILAFANVMTTAAEGGGDGRPHALRSRSAERQHGGAVRPPAHAFQAGGLRMVLARHGAACRALRESGRADLAPRRQSRLRPRRSLLQFPRAARLQEQIRSGMGAPATWRSPAASARCSRSPTSRC